MNHPLHSQHALRQRLESRREGSAARTQDVDRPANRTSFLRHPSATHVPVTAWMCIRYASRRASLAVVRRGIGLFVDLLRRVRIRRVDVDLSVGTDDPATTGELVGFAAPFVAIANALPRTRLSLTPDFGGEALDGTGVGEVRIVPLKLVPPIFAFAVSPEVRGWLFARR